MPRPETGCHACSGGVAASFPDATIRRHAQELVTARPGDRPDPVSFGEPRHETVCGIAQSRLPAMRVDEDVGVEEQIHWTGLWSSSFTGACTSCAGHRGTPLARSRTCVSRSRFIGPACGPRPSLAPARPAPAAAALLSPGAGRACRRQSPNAGPPVNRVAQLGPGVLFQRIGRPRIAGSQIRERVSVASRRGREHPPEPFLDHGAQRAPRLRGMPLGASEELVVNVDGRLHGPILPIHMVFGQATQHGARQSREACARPGPRVRMRSPEVP